MHTAITPQNNKYGAKGKSPMRSVSSPQLNKMVDNQV
jgi:hypothetical protein